LEEEWRNLSFDEQLDKKKFTEYQFGSFTPNLCQRVLIFIANKTFFKRGFFRIKFTQLIMSLTKGPLDIHFRNCAFRIYGENNLIEYGILLNPKYNQTDIDFLLEDSKSNSNFVDLGCNIGLYSLPLASSAPNGTVISIDANPLMQSRLSFNANSSGIKNIQIICSAVSDKTGEGSLLIRKNDTAIVSVNEDIKGSIKIDKLENIIREQGLKSIYGLKIDIEGHEDKALVPFLLNVDEDLLPKRIVIEKKTKNSDYPGCAIAFKKLNYTLVSRSRNNSFYKKL
jgi:FkbM family methyltransferase